MNIGSEIKNINKFNIDTVSLVHSFSDLDVFYYYNRLLPGQGKKFKNHRGYDCFLKESTFHKRHFILTYTSLTISASLPKIYAGSQHYLINQKNFHEAVVEFVRPFGVNANLFNIQRVDVAAFLSLSLSQYKVITSCFDNYARYNMVRRPNYYYELPDGSKCIDSIYFWNKSNNRVIHAYFSKNNVLRFEVRRGNIKSRSRLRCISNYDLAQFEHLFNEAKKDIMSIARLPSNNFLNSTQHDKEILPFTKEDIISPLCPIKYDINNPDKKSTAKSLISTKNRISKKFPQPNSLHFDTHIEKVLKKSIDYLHN